MRKLFVLLTMSLLVVAASAQKLSWPPKSYPVKVPFTVSEAVSYTHLTLPTILLV